jgi:hypothetical protein
MAGSSPGNFSRVCIGFADILALPDQKTIHQSWAGSVFVQALGATKHGPRRRNMGHEETLRRTMAAMAGNWAVAIMSFGCRACGWLVHY